jgi:hypothetical protein
MSEVCKYGDPYCPCQDGDMCHYEGQNPMNPRYLIENARNAMRVVFSHKVGDVECMSPEVWDLLAETAVKAVLLQQEKLKC